MNQVWDCLQHVHASTPHSRSAPCDTLQSSPRLRWRSTRNPPRQMWRPTISKLVLRRKILDLPSPSNHLRPKKSSHQKFLHHYIPLLLGMMAVDYYFGFYFRYESLDDPAIYQLGEVTKVSSGMGSDSATRHDNLCRMSVLVKLHQVWLRMIIYCHVHVPQHFPIGVLAHLLSIALIKFMDHASMSLEQREDYQCHVSAILVPCCFWFSQIFLRLWGTFRSRTVSAIPRRFHAPRRFSPWALQRQGVLSGV